MSRAFAVAAAIALSIPAVASAQIVCTPQQIGTGDGYNFGWPRTSRNGDRIAFMSAANLTQQNADHSWEVFLYDVPSSQLTQITNTTDAFSGNDVPSISADGRRIVYRRMVGTGQTAYFDIWLYDTVTTTRTLVSLPANPAFAMVGEISADGSKIVIEQANVGIRLYDVATATTTTLPIGGTNPRISGDGRYVVVETFQGHVKYIDVTTNTVTQVPGVSTINTRPSISADGSTIAFTAAQDLTGFNGDGSKEVFTYDIATGRITQVSKAPSGYSQMPQISDNGLVVGWEGNHNANSTNQGGNYNVFLYQWYQDVVTNLSKTAGPLTWQVGVAGDASQFAFVSNADLTGQNPTHVPQLFLACGGNRPPVANAGPDRAVTGGPTGSATITLDGSGSYDADADPLTFTWWGQFVNATGAQPQVTLQSGLHTIFLTVDDGTNVSTDIVKVTVNGCTAPTVTARAKPAQVQLLWTSAPNAAGYRVYRSTTQGGPSTAIATLPSSALAYLDRPLTNGTTYYYSVHTLGALGAETCQSPEVSATPTGR